MTWLTNPYRFGSADPYDPLIEFELGMGAPGAAPVDVSGKGRTVTEIGTNGDFVADAGPIPGMSAWKYPCLTSGVAVDQLRVDLSAVPVAGDYTLEVWACKHNFSGNNNAIVNWGVGRRLTTGVGFAGANSHYLRVGFPGTPVGAWPGYYDTDAGHGQAYVPGTWGHFCLERQGGVVRFYFNGDPWELTHTDATTISAVLSMGGQPNNALSTMHDWRGLIGPVRLTTAARYGGAAFIPGFTPGGRMTSTVPEFPSTMAWARVCWTALNGGDQVRLNEVEMRETPGGATINSTKAALPTYTSTAGTAANAFLWDRGDTNICDLTTPGNIRVDLLSAFAIRHFAVQAGSSVPPKCPTNFTLEYSDNDSTWTVAVTRTGETGWTRYEGRGFHVPDVGAHRYWRLVVTGTSSGSTAEIMELALNLSPSGPNVAQSSRNYGTAYDANWSGSKMLAFDANNTNGPARVFGTTGWMGQRFSSPVAEIAEIKIWTAAGNQTYTPSAGSVWLSEDGLRWQRRWSWSGLTTWASDEDKVITKP